MIVGTKTDVKLTEAAQKVTGRKAVLQLKGRS